MPPGKSVLWGGCHSCHTYTDHEYVMHTHDASGVTHINASDPSDRRLVIFELVEYDVTVVPDDRRGLAELNVLRWVWCLQSVNYM